MQKRSVDGGSRMIGFCSLPLFMFMLCTHHHCDESRREQLYRFLLALGFASFFSDSGLCSTCMFLLFSSFPHLFFSFLLSFFPLQACLVLMFIFLWLLLLLLPTLLLILHPHIPLPLLLSSSSSSWHFFGFFIIIASSLSISLAFCWTRTERRNREEAMSHPIIGSRREEEQQRWGGKWRECLLVVCLIILAVIVREISFSVVVLLSLSCLSRRSLLVLFCRLPLFWYYLLFSFLHLSFFQFVFLFDSFFLCCLSTWPFYSVLPDYAWDNGVSPVVYGFGLLFLSFIVILYVFVLAISPFFFLVPSACWPKTLRFIAVLSTSSILLQQPEQKRKEQTQNRRETNGRTIDEARLKKSIE